MMTKPKNQYDATGDWMAWFAGNGRPFWSTPRALYELTYDWNDRPSEELVTRDAEYWVKRHWVTGGWYSLGADENWPHDGLLFTSNSKEEVQKVIDTALALFEENARSNGLTNAWPTRPAPEDKN